MAKRMKKSGLAGHLGTKGRAAFNEHKTDDTDYGRGSGLPGTIEAGIAQLTECKFGVYATGENKGEYYFSASGAVLQPETAMADDGGGMVNVQGLHTRIGPRGMCETKSKSLDENLSWVLNEMRKLGVDTGEAELAELEGLAAAIKEETPHFRFRTWKPDVATEGEYKGRDTNVLHFWNGTCEYDESEEEDPVDERVERAAKKSTKKKAKEEPDDLIEDEPEEDEVEPESGGNILALGEDAEAGDADAQAKLSDLAAAADVDADVLDTWMEVAQALVADGEEEGEDDEDEDEEEEYVPSKDETVAYKPKGKRKPVECVVTTTFPRKKTCNLKNLVSGVVYKQVAWNQLSESE